MERKKSALKFFFFKAAKQHQKFRILPWSARFVAVATQTRLLPPGLINFVASRLYPVRNSSVRGKSIPDTHIRIPSRGPLLATCLARYLTFIGISYLPPHPPPSPPPFVLACTRAWEIRYGQTTEANRLRGASRSS